MFIQVTKEKFIRHRDIIGVFDLDTSTVSGVTKNFLSTAEKNNKTTGLNILPKSFILTCGNNKNKDYKIYFSSNMTGHICKSGFDKK